MKPPRVLVAGIGNIFWGDDAFGVAVVQRLLHRTRPEEVKVTDFGIRGISLVHALLDGPEAVILIDAVSRGGTPGTLYVIEPEIRELPTSTGPDMMLDMHQMQPDKILRVVRAMGGRLPWIRLVGCEPAELGTDEDPVMGLTDVVQAVVPEAVSMVESLIAEALALDIHETSPLRSSSCTS